MGRMRKNQIWNLFNLHFVPWHRDLPPSRPQKQPLTLQDGKCSPVYVAELALPCHHLVDPDQRKWLSGLSKYPKVQWHQSTSKLLEDSYIKRWLKMIEIYSLFLAHVAITKRLLHPPFGAFPLAGALKQSAAATATHSLPQSESWSKSTIIWRFAIPALAKERPGHFFSLASPQTLVWHLGFNPCMFNFGSRCNSMWNSMKLLSVILHFIRRATMIGYSGWSHPATSPLKRLCSASLARLRQEPWWCGSCASCGHGISSGWSDQKPVVFPNIFLTQCCTFGSCVQSNLADEIVPPHHIDVDSKKQIWPWRGLFVHIRPMWKLQVEADCLMIF